MLIKKNTITRIFLILFSALALDSMAGTLYWVGNSGNWNDARHWSHTSGGAGGAGIPNSTDDVFFDLNSFSNPNQQILIFGTATCHTLQFSSDVDSPILAGNSTSAIDIYGSILLEGPLDYTFQGSMHFKSSQLDNVIKPGARKLGNVSFDGSGSWKMYSILDGSDVSLSSGSLTTNGFELECTSLTIAGYSHKVLDISNSILFIEQQVNQQNSGGLQFTSANGKIYLQHYQVSSLSSTAHTTHRVMTVDSSHYGSSNLTCSSSDSLGNHLAPCNGRAWITTIYPVLGGPYSIQWSIVVGNVISANGDTLDDVCPPSTSYQIFDSSDNSLSSATIVTILAPKTLNIVYNVREPLCNGYCDGWIHYYITGETPNYTYAWYGGSPAGITPGGPSHYLYDSALCKGNYKIHIVDANGCHTTPNVVKLSTVNPVFANITSTPPSCSYSCNGTATALPGGGHPLTTYTYVWEAPKQTTQTAVNLCPGTYTVVVFDDSLCSSTDSVKIIAPPVITLSATFTNDSCFGECDGTATATPGGGSGSFTYLWNSVPTQTTAKATGLCAGTYKVVVTDKNGCKDSTNVTISQPAALQVTSISTTNNPLACGGNCNASASASVTGGTGPYTYSWSNGGSGISIVSLCAGKYIVTTTDAHGCSTKDSVTITQPAPLAVTLISQTNLACHGACTGTISTSTSGGAVPYSYSWSSGQTTSNITNLCAGNYTLTVTDKNGCVDSSMVVTITQPPSINVTLKLNDVTCKGLCNGLAIATASGGTPTYTYKWNNSAAQTNDTLKGLCASSDSIKVTDALGCTSTTYFSITQPAPLTPLVTSNNSACAICNGSSKVIVFGGTPGYTYSWNTLPVQTTDSATNLCAGNYTLTITDADGCDTTQKVKIVPTVNITITASPSGLSCFGACDGVASANASGGSLPYTYSWSNGQITSNATAFCAGTYTITVHDVVGCVNTDSVTFVNPPKLTGSTSHTDISCSGACVGTAADTAKGGTPPYSYSWTSGSTKSTATALCLGQYICTITDKDGCTSVDTVNITQAPAIAPNPTFVSPSCLLSNGSITVHPTGGIGLTYTYLWSTGATATTATISGIGAGTYTVTITDSLGCGASFAISLSNTTGPTLSSTLVPATCWASCNGKDSVFVVAGTPTYTYLWSTGSTWKSVSNLCPGPYFCQVTDGLGCVTIENDTIQRPTPISPHLTFSNVSCNGAGDGTISFAPTGGNAGGYTYTWNPLVSSTSSAAGLGPLTYTITIADSKGCDTIVNVTIIQPVVLSVVMTFTNVTCNGNCDGQATGTVSGGTGPYIYSWSNGGVLPNIINLCPGGYTVNVIDANGCKATGNVTITQPAALSAVMTHANVLCNGGSDGTATITVSGGTLPYSYSWASGTSNITTLTAGTYVVTVTDKNLCSLTDSVTITQPAPITIGLTLTSVTCNGNCDGKGTPAVAGGTPGYTFSWSDGETTNPAIMLCPGTFTLTVKDANGCTQSKDSTIAEPAALFANASMTSTLCPSSCDGTAKSLPIGGTGPYTYLWSTGAVTNSINNLCAGNYWVLVTDANLCTDTGKVTVTNPAPITVGVGTVASNCGVCNGKVTVTPSGGTPGYTYLWNTAVTTDSITSACAGVYTYTITDVNHCTATFTVILPNSSGPTGVTLTTINDSCFSECNGVLIIPPIGGTAPYTYTFNSGPTQTSDTATALCSGTYTFVVTDAAGCKFSDTSTVAQPAMLSDVTTITNAACSGICSGTINVVTSGGTAPYKYSWSNGQLVPNINNLCPGIYTLTVADAHNCTLIEVDTVKANIHVISTFSTTDSLCYGNCTGTVTLLSVTGGTNPYTYSWSNGLTTTSIISLCAGNYTLTITDAVGCTETDTAFITQPPALQVTFNTTPIECNGNCDGMIVANVSGGTPGYNYSWTTSASTTDTAANLCFGTYSVTVTDNNGCMLDTSKTITNPPVLTDNNIMVNPTCNTTDDGSVTVTASGGILPYTFVWSTGASSSGVTFTTISNLLPGTYTLTITDSTNCSLVDIVVLTADTTVIAKAGNDTSICLGSTAKLNGSGSISATEYEWFALPRTLVGTTVDVNVTPLTTTTYMLVASDGSCRDSAEVTVTVNPQPVASAGASQSIFLGITATLGGTPTGPAGSTFVWEPSAGMKDSTAANPVVSPTVTTVYTVTVTSAFGCTSIDTVTIFVLPQFTPPDGFTPNGDGINDTWILPDISNFPNVYVEIFNRWGERVFHSVGYKIPWNGTYMDQALPVGTYYYIVNMNDPRFPNAYTGPVTIMR